MRCCFSKPRPNKGVSSWIGSVELVLEMSPHHYIITCDEKQPGKRELVVILRMWVVYTFFRDINVRSNGINILEKSQLVDELPVQILKVEFYWLMSKIFDKIRLWLIFIIIASQHVSLNISWWVFFLQPASSAVFYLFNWLLNKQIRNKKLCSTNLSFSNHTSDNFLGRAKSVSC